MPRPSDDHGIADTPKCCKPNRRFRGGGGIRFGGGKAAESGAYVQRREHLPLLFAVDQAVVVLHGDERRQVVRDRVVCAGSCLSGGPIPFQLVRWGTHSA